MPLSLEETQKLLDVVVADCSTEGDAESVLFICEQMWHRPFSFRDSLLGSCEQSCGALRQSLTVVKLSVSCLAVPHQPLCAQHLMKLMWRVSLTGLHHRGPPCPLVHLFCMFILKSDVRNRNNWQILLVLYFKDQLIYFSLLKKEWYFFVEWYHCILALLYNWIIHNIYNKNRFVQSTMSFSTPVIP